jgi:2'-hydroxyisoflavone reductase
MKILILGGTRFLGRHIAQQALEAGHELTLLHRGRSNATLFPEAEHRIADRDGDLGALRGGSWDVAIDTSAYFPRQVRQLAAALEDRVSQYQLVSTISVYAGFDTPDTTEDAPLAQLSDPTVEKVTGETYGGLKVLCEAAAEEGFPGRCLVSRPGLIVGPHDPTGRFTWWVQRYERAAAGEAVIAPGDPAGPVQFIDVRDLAAWHLRQAELGATGICNVTGPEEPLTMGAFIDALRATLQPAARPLWVGEDFLLAQGVAPWSDLPVWLPRAQAALHQTNIDRALLAGLHCRPLAQTLADTAAWAGSAPTVVPAAPGAPARPPVGLAPEREAALLADWRSTIHPAD